MRRDGVTDWEELRPAVIRRDRSRCMAPILDPDAGPCFDRWGYPAVINADGTFRFPETTLTLNHVSDAPTMASRAPDDADHLVTVCWGHHLGTGPNHGVIWATTRKAKELQRDYLRRLQAGEKPGQERR